MPYEKRILDVLKTGGTSSEKRVYKFAKRRVSTSITIIIIIHIHVSLYIFSYHGSSSSPYPFFYTQLGTHRRALKKREEIKEYYGKLRARQAQA